MLNWYAPALAGSAEGLERWDVPSLTRFMKTGVAQQGAAFGPMAEVVRLSLQHLSDEDLHAMAVYMKALPPAMPPEFKPVLKPRAAQALVKEGGPLYEKHCADCHGKDGGGKPLDIPPLQGNQSVTTPLGANAIRMVLNGGFAPSTQGNPRPMGMPPYGPFLTDREVAAVVSYIRAEWGNQGAAVGPDEVAKLRSVPIE
jgi:mono/diheme cytochrome c family protein